VQDEAVKRMRGAPGFIGTSNVEMAKKYGVPAKGTSAHEMVMGLSGLVGPAKANEAWADAWHDYFKGKLGVGLPDTFSTDVFLRTVPVEKVARLAGLRQDSGDAKQWADNVLAYYQRNNIDPKTKSIVFSDSLDPERALELHRAYGDKTNVSFGIGTNFSNDVGHKALNMVIKLTKVDFGKGPVDVVKLSDNPGKETGRRDVVDLVKKQLGIS
jgi:nicotinate phosphoribosyltransferase